jgi:hypothetical protein
VPERVASAGTSEDGKVQNAAAAEAWGPPASGEPWRGRTSNLLIKRRFGDRTPQHSGHLTARILCAAA